MFADWFAPLAASPALDGFRVIRLRRAGYLSGPPPTHHLTLRDHARHAGAVLDALGINAAHVCGHSSSCLINLQLAMDRPSCVASLMLIDPAPGAVLQAPSQQDLTGSVARPALAAATAGDIPAFDTWMAGVSPDYQQVLEATLGRDGYRQGVGESDFFFTDEMPAVREWALDRDAAARTVAPVLLILGAHSPANFYDMVDLLAGVLTGAEIATVDGVGHLMPLESPGRVGTLVADFARRHANAPVRRAHTAQR